MKIIKILALLFIMFMTNLFAQETSKPQLEEQFQSEVRNQNVFIESKKVTYKESWTAIEGILKYRLEIYDLNNNPVYIIETEKNELEISILPGVYKKRLGLINKFNKLFLYTDWKEFEVYEIPTPIVTYIEKKTIESNKEKEEFQLSVNGLTDSTQIFIKKKDSKELIPVEFKQIDTNRLKINVSPISLKEGEYNIIIKNSDKKTTEIESALIIKDFEEIEESKIKIKWSYLMPGLVQKERNEHHKGNILQWGFIGSMVIAGFNYNQALKYEKRYNNLIKNYSITNLFNPSQATLGIFYYIYQTTNIQNKINNYNEYKNLYTLGLGAAIIIYSYHIYDIIQYEFYLTPQPKEIGLQISFNF